MEDLSDFEKGQIIGARLTGASVIKSATLLAVSRATVFKVMSAYTKHWKTTSAKKNSERNFYMDRKRSSYTEKDYFEYHRNGARATAELNTHSEDLISARSVRRELHQSSIHSRVAIAKPLVTVSSAQMHKRWCHDHKSWTSNN
jgi:hypothetical protein